MKDLCYAPVFACIGVIQREHKGVIFNRSCHEARIQAKLALVMSFTLQIARNSGHRYNRRDWIESRTTQK